MHDPPKDQSYQEIDHNQPGEVPTVVPTPSGVVSGPTFPADLATVVAAWERLPDAIKAAILALVNTTGGAIG